ncbi:diguanylate cyclase [Candidatus Neomarinimicrobiota bacterium]
MTALLFYPKPEVSWIFLIKGLMTFGIMWGMLSYILIVHFGSNQSKKAVSYKKIGHKKDPLKDQPEKFFKAFLNQIFNQILSINSEYIVSVYMSDPTKDGFAIQHSTVHNSVEFLSKKNAIIKTIGKKTDGLIIQQNINPEAWTELFGKKQWRGSECLIGASIDFNGTLMGYLIVSIDHFSKINEKDIQLISHLGKFISYGINIIDRLEYLQRNIYFNRKINQLFNLLDITSDKSSIYKAVTNVFSEFIKYDLFTISVGQVLKKHAVLEWQDGRFEVENNQIQFLTDSSVYGLPYKSDEIVNTRNWHDDYPNLMRCKENDPNDEKVKSMLMIPITISEKYKGAIGIERAVDQQFSPSDLWVMNKIADILGIMLKWHFDFETIKINAIHDDLTGLLNYRAFMKRCEEEISRATRFNQKLVLVVIDIDAFKQVNDNFGHEFGNMVLKDISSIFKNSVRNIDVVGRYGGEEFIIILVDTDKDKSQIITQRIVDNIANYPIFKDGQKVKISISAGIAEFPSDSEKVKSILEKADKAMYSAKRAGGNMVKIYIEDN